MISYFDNCATTRVDDTVLQIIQKYNSELYYNPSARSSHSLQIANDVAAAREIMCKALGATQGELIFTSGGTESDNLAILGSLRAKQGNIVVTASEHSAVYNTVTALQSKGYDIRLANVTTDGHIDTADFLSKIDNQTLLACFMHVNNETGAINDVRYINEQVKQINSRTVTMVDGVQAVGKIPVNLTLLGVDLYAFSGHKFHASKGIGGLYVKKGVRLQPIVLGGGQEKGTRSGTEYVAGIVSMATALQTAVQNVSSNAQKFEEYKQIIREQLSTIDNYKENCTNNVSPCIMSLAFADIKGEVLLRMLEDNDVIVGTGSACSSKNKQSRIAKAIGLPINYSEGIIRISFSKYNTTEEVVHLAKTLKDCVVQLRKTMLGI